MLMMVKTCKTRIRISKRSHVILFYNVSLGFDPRSLQVIDDQFSFYSNEKQTQEQTTVTTLSVDSKMID